MNMHVEPQTLINFATFLSQCYDDLEPWSKGNAWRYTPNRSAFAGSAGANDIEYEFTYLTTEEFTNETGKKLDKDKDPGGLNGPDWIHNLEAWSPPWAGSAADQDLDLMSQRRNWTAYYQARGVSASEGTIVDDSPGGAGPAPWAVPLHQDWHDAVETRTRECSDVREEIAFLMPILKQAAEEYTDTDFENAAGIDMATFQEIDGPPPADREADSSPGADRE